MPLLFRKWAVLFALPILFCSAPFSVLAADIKQQAESKQLWEKQHWHRLLHYRASGNGVVSLAGGNRLFISNTGATDPKSELLETIDAFLENRFLEQRAETALCAFPARLRWIKQELDLSAEDFPAFECEQREIWRRELSPVSATLVFPDAFISSPGSMFGHTLLRINGSHTGAKAGLLAYAVNFAADANGVGPIAYGVKGIAGGFPGHFGVFPYYTKVKDYARIENRDLWEYPLELSTTELTNLMEHLWELQQVPFRYYFFNRNCSWQLLALLEVAKPDAELLDGFDWYAVPVDTVRKLQSQGLVNNPPHLRPSRQREINAVHDSMTRQQRHLANQLVAGDVGPDDARVQSLPVDQQITLFDTAYELINMRFLKRSVQREEALPRAHKILVARSKLGKPQATAKQYSHSSPDQAHRSGRIGVSLGEDELGQWLGLSIRPAFHDLLDPDSGFLPGYGIDFFNIKARQYFEPETLRLEEFTVISASSRNAWTSWSKPSSWGLKIGLKRPGWLRGLVDDPKLGGGLSGDMGITLGNSRFLLSMSGAGEAYWGKIADKNGRVSAGLRLGSKIQISPAINATLDLTADTSIAGYDLETGTVSAAAQWQITPNNGLRIRYTASDNSVFRSADEYMLRWLHYF